MATRSNSPESLKPTIAPGISEAMTIFVSRLTSRSENRAAMRARYRSARSTSRVAASRVKHSVVDSISLADDAKQRDTRSLGPSQQYRRRQTLLGEPGAVERNQDAAVVSAPRSGGRDRGRPDYEHRQPRFPNQSIGDASQPDTGEASSSMG